MKETKFRLIKDNKIVGYEEHRRINDGMGKFNVFIYHSRTQHPMSWKDITSCPEEYIKHDNKNQYTGLKDKNGKEVYEGDVVKSEWGYGYPDPIEVTLENIFYWKGECCTNDTMEIVGNIYSNPELLENK